MSEDEAQLNEESTPVEDPAVEASPAEDVPAEPVDEAPSETPIEASADTPSEAPSDTAAEANADTAAEADVDTAIEGEEAGDPDEAPASDGPAVSTVVEVGAVVEGTVQRTTPYGAFIQLPGGKLGLIHISEIDRNYVKDVTEHVREGDAVKAKILAIKEDGKIDLSIKALQDPAPRVQRRGSDPGFESMLRKFMRQSEERQVDVKRSVMNKRK